MFLLQDLYRWLGRPAAMTRAAGFALKYRIRNNGPGPVRDWVEWEAVGWLSQEILDTALWNELNVPYSSGKLVACRGNKLPCIARGFSPERPLNPVE